LLRARIVEMWSEASRWPGPPDEAGYQAAVEQGMVSEGPEAVRRRVRDWLSERLAAEGATIVLEDPCDWSTWDRESRR
jgi:hypothetical protein